MATANTAVLTSLDAKVHSLAEILAVFHRDGGVIVHNMLSDEVRNSLRSELAESMQSTTAGTKSSDKGVQEFWGSNTKRFTRLAYRSKSFRDHVLVHPLLRGVANSELGPHCASYWMNTGQAMIIGPGEKAQWLHRDADNWPLILGPTAKPVTVSCMFALSDFTAESGATRVVPGSHKWDDFSRKAQDHEISQAIMPAGSALIYSGTVLHGGGANTTSTVWREGMHLSFLVGWLTPEEAGCIGIPEDIARTLTPDQQQLLGYRCYSGDVKAARLWTIDYEDIPVGMKWE
jgi:ectoine hydroxylase-related dioxygenase (phytanoyl-CoA dioxygenase family)